MKSTLLSVLACPKCKGTLQIQDEIIKETEIERGCLSCVVCQKLYPIINNVPRFVPKENYASTFGFQWNIFRKAQLDSYSGVPISRNRFLQFSGWSPDDLDGKRVLDLGCGSGRFAEIALSFGADVVAVDYSSAVDACWANFAFHPNLNVVQGDIFELPFAPGSFDFVYCFGVLQHTPCPEQAFASLLSQISSGGQLAIDIYPKLLRNCFWSKYWIRPLTRRLPPDRLFRVMPSLVKILLPVSRLVGRIPLLGPKLKYMIPVANYEGVYPLSETQLKEWAILDTFDMLSPRYDLPQSYKTLEKWFEKSGLNDYEIFRKGFLVGRGRR